MSAKPWGLSDIYARQPGYGQTNPIPGGGQGRGGVTRIDRGFGSATLIAGSTW